MLHMGVGTEKSCVGYVYLESYMDILRDFLQLHILVEYFE